MQNFKNRWAWGGQAPLNPPQGVAPPGPRPGALPPDPRVLGSLRSPLPPPPAFGARSATALNRHLAKLDQIWFCWFLGLCPTPFLRFLGVRGSSQSPAKSGPQYILSSRYAPAKDRVFSSIYKDMFSESDFRLSIDLTRCMLSWIVLQKYANFPSALSVVNATAIFCRKHEISKHRWWSSFFCSRLIVLKKIRTKAPPQQEWWGGSLFASLMGRAGRRVVRFTGVQNSCKPQHKRGRGVGQADASCVIELIFTTIEQVDSGNDNHGSPSSPSRELVTAVWGMMGRTLMGRINPSHYSETPLVAESIFPQ